MPDRWRIIEVEGASPTSVGGMHPEKRLAPQIEKALNQGAVDGYTLDRIERTGLCALVIMRRDNA